MTKAPPERERSAAQQVRLARLQRPSEGWESGPDKFIAQDEDDDLDQQPYVKRLVAGAIEGVDARGPERGGYLVTHIAGNRVCQQVRTLPRRRAPACVKRPLRTP